MKKSPYRSWVKFLAGPSCFHSNPEFVVWLWQECGGKHFSESLAFQSVLCSCKRCFTLLKGTRTMFDIYFSLMTVGWDWLLIWLLLFMTCSLMTSLRKTNQFGENTDKNSRKFIIYLSASLCQHASLHQVLPILEYLTVLFKEFSIFWILSSEKN